MYLSFVFHQVLPMGFDTELQGRTSHEALLSLQDAEIRLLETMRKCLVQRVKSDREYAMGLNTMVSMAHKVDNMGEFTTPVFQVRPGLIF